MDSTLIVCRFVHYLASLLLFGLTLFQAVLAPVPLANSVNGQFRRYAFALSTTAAVSSVVWLALTSVSMADGWSTGLAPDIVFQTAFGQVWQWHMALSVVSVALIAWPSTRQPNRWWIVAAAISGLQIITLGLVGHAVMQSGLSGILSRASQAAHLLAAGYWIGTLVPVAMCARSIDDLLSRDRGVALRRFSAIGQVVVILVVGTGFLNMTLIEDHLTLDPSHPYQMMLDIKIVIVGLMAAMALANRYWFVPKLAGNAAVVETIRRIILLVAALGIGVIGLASVIGTLSPT